MKAEIISIGTELLLGHIVNTNTAYLSQKLAEIGIDVYHHSTVGDNPKRLVESIKKALSRSDIVITTGGLGPTVDDITVEVIAKLTNTKLILNKSVLKDLKDYFKLRNIKLPSDSIRQAYQPEGAKVIRNKVGTAPGLIIEYNNKTIQWFGGLTIPRMPRHCSAFVPSYTEGRTIPSYVEGLSNDTTIKPSNHTTIVCLPGPPRELEPMFENFIVPYLKKKTGGGWLIKSRLIKTTGLAESQVNEKVKDLLRIRPPTTVGIYAKLGEVDLRIMAKAKTNKEAFEAIKRIEKKICSRLKDYIFGYDNEALEAAVGKILREKRKTIAIAESCTGGLVSDRLTNVSGSSDYFIMGVIAYSNEAKENVLGLSKRLIQKYGAVSKAVALEMANGIKFLARVDIGIGITGIAGPTGGTKLKPVGLVYIALVSDEKEIVTEFRFKGLRQEIKFQASQAALDMVRKFAQTQNSK